MRTLQPSWMGSFCCILLKEGSFLSFFTVFQLYSLGHLHKLCFCFCCYVSVFVSAFFYLFALFSVCVAVFVLVLVCVFIFQCMWVFVWVCVCAYMCSFSDFSLLMSFLCCFIFYVWLYSSGFTWPSIRCWCTAYNFSYGMI